MFKLKSRIVMLFLFEVLMQYNRQTSCDTEVSHLPIRYNNKCTGSILSFVYNMWTRSRTRRFWDDKSILARCT